MSKSRASKGPIDGYSTINLSNLSSAMIKLYYTVFSKNNPNHEFNMAPSITNNFHNGESWLKKINKKREKASKDASVKKEDKEVLKSRFILKDLSLITIHLINQILSELNLVGQDITSLDALNLYFEESAEDEELYSSIIYHSNKIADTFSGKDKTILDILLSEKLADKNLIDLIVQEKVELFGNSKTISANIYDKIIRFIYVIVIKTSKFLYYNGNAMFATLSNSIVYGVLSDISNGNDVLIQKLSNEIEEIKNKRPKKTVNKKTAKTTVAKEPEPEQENEANLDLVLNGIANMEDY